MFRHLLVLLIALLVLAAFGLVGANDYEDEQLLANVKGPR